VAKSSLLQRKAPGTEFKGKYLGGHPALPTNREVLLKLDYETLRVNELNLSISYTAITNVEFTTKDKIQGILLVFGFPIFWKKEVLFLVLTYKDDLNMERNLVFKMNDTVGSQEALYAKRHSQK
jgi:hypothetical protein